ncbi:hypothetical protein [Rhizobium rhizogenes]|uniref:Large polyvalent protein associated domain-containing protein n=1 Tax=Rhizobium rhizogenes TaxID=359 RepID=A0AA92C6U0_RHIRH|nr:hypothetical protein [Rhizobium rhizogenes]PVE57162.1 hypothetical protein DC430_05405 [Rhizobium rhizogenes]PVE68323.1 hypothetical protein DC415_00810 [Agrobacterium tumefaciens]PVE78071.1 hypothetical protein DCP16_00810 [Sphingomonas sp. TPD3009]
MSPEENRDRTRTQGGSSVKQMAFELQYLDGGVEYFRVVDMDEFLSGRTSVVESRSKLTAQESAQKQIELILEQNPRLHEALKAPGHAGLTVKDLASLALFEQALQRVQQEDAYDSSLKKTSVSEPLPQSVTTAPSLQRQENKENETDEVKNLSRWERLTTAFQQGDDEATVQGNEYFQDLSIALESSALNRLFDDAGRKLDESLLTNDDGTPNLFGRFTNYVRKNASAGDQFPREQVGGADVTIEQRVAAIKKRGYSPLYYSSKERLAKMEKDGFKVKSYDDVDGFDSALMYIGENVAKETPKILTSMASGLFSIIFTTADNAASVNKELKEKLPDMPLERRVAVATGVGVFLTAWDNVPFLFGKFAKGGRLRATDIISDAARPTTLRSIGGFVGETIKSGAEGGANELIKEGVTMGAPAVLGARYEDKEAADRLINKLLSGAVVGGGEHIFKGATESLLRAARRWRSERFKASEAADTKNAMDQMSDAAANSDIRTQHPEAFREFVAKMTKGTNVRQVYIPVDKIDEIVQRHGGNPAKVLEAWHVDKADWETAHQTRGSVKFSIEDYETYVAGGQYDLDLRPHISLDPSAKTHAEGLEFKGKESELVAQAEKDAKAALVIREQNKTISQAEYQRDVESRQASGASPEQAHSGALAVTTMRTVRIGKSGRTPDDFGLDNTSSANASSTNQGQSRAVSEGAGPAQPPPSRVEDGANGNIAPVRAPGDKGASVFPATGAASNARVPGATLGQKGPRLGSVPESIGGSMPTEQLKRMLQSSTAPASRLEPPGPSPKILDQQGPAVPTDTPWSARRDKLERNGR